MYHDAWPSFMGPWNFLISNLYVTLMPNAQGRCYSRNIFGNNKHFVFNCVCLTIVLNSFADRDQETR